MKKYTLCKFSAIVLLFIGVCVWLWCLPEFSDKGVSGRQVDAGDMILAAGTVASIEEKENAYHQKQTIVSLNSVTFCNKSFQEDKKQISEGILCYLKAGEAMPFYGQQIIVSGTAGCFSKRRNPGGFDAAFYYRTKGIEFYLEDAEIKKQGADYDIPRHRLFLLRRYLGKKLEEICGADAGIMQSILLGDKAFLSGEVKELYQIGGISHILAISGLHISFFGAGLYRICRRLWLPMRMSAIVSGSILGVYVIMTGASASACRAGMMFLIYLLADVFGRSYDRRTALAFSALLQVLSNPFLLGQSGFWLSYGAVLGLEVIAPAVSSLWENRLCKLFAGSISVFLITLPVLLLSYYEFPIYSFLLNLLVIPLMSVVMAMGLAALLAGLFWLPFGKLLFFPVHIILLVFEAGCRLCVKLPGNLWIIGKPELWRILLYICLLLCFLLLGKYRTKASALLTLLGAVWILTGIVPLNSSVMILDVGQGDGIVIRDKLGHTAMIDGGSSSENKLAEYTLLPYLKSQGIKELDYVFLTHMDADHISGIVELLERRVNGQTEVPIKTLVVPKLEAPDEAYLETVRLAKAAGSKVCTMKKGDLLSTGELHFACMHPQEEISYADKNEASLVLYLQMEEMKALFMGDLDGEAERVFAGEYPKQLSEVTLLKVGHHGSAASCSNEFLEKVKPKYAVVSCGEDNPYGHPAAETLERLFRAGSEVLTTPEYGAVKICINEKIYTVESRERYVIK